MSLLVLWTIELFTMMFDLDYLLWSYLWLYVFFTHSRQPPPSSWLVLMYVPGPGIFDLLWYSFSCSPNLSRFEKVPCLEVPGNDMLNGKLLLCCSKDWFGFLGEYSPGPRCSVDCDDLFINLGFTLSKGFN